jgi:hypothetical protein
MKRVFSIVLILASLTSVGQNVTTINVAAIRSWLGLGDASTLPSASVLQASNNLSDLQSASTARTNLGLSNTANLTNSTNKNFVTDAQLTVIGNTSGTNSGDNAVNSNYTNDYRASNFVAGTNYLAPNGSAAGLTNNTGGYTVVKVTTSDVTNSTTSMADITGLVTATLSNATYYEFEIMIVANSSSTAGGTYQVVLGGSGTGSVVALNVTATTGTATASLQNIGASAAATTAVMTLNGEGVVIMRGFIKTLSSGTATVKVQQAKTTSGNLIARVGSYLKYKQM